MKKFAAVYILFMIIAISNLAGQGVDTVELEKNIKEVEFINYQGPHEVIESRSAIMSIGDSLAEIISSGSMQGSVSGKYRILHLLDSSEPDKKGADIVIVEADAKVDHIRNLRLILAAYLTKMYTYNNQDAMLIAEFITYYNAVYRGNLDYLGKIYINKVMVNLSKENAGIDINYKNWPGKTRLVIPLKSAADGASQKPDAFALADKGVVEDLRKGDNMGIDERKKIVELQEESLAEDKKALADKEQGVAQKEQGVAEKESAVDQKQKELDQKKESGQITEAQAQEEQKKIDEEKSAVEEEKQQVAAEKEAAEAQRRDIEQKEESIAESRESIAQDSNTVRDREAAGSTGTSLASGLGAPSGRVPFLRLEESDKGFFGHFVLYDLAEQKLLIPSDAPVVGGRLYIDTPSGYVMPARSEKGSFVLTVLSKEELSPVIRGNEEIYTQSYLLYLDNKIYCTVRMADKLVIGKYSHDLKLEAASDIEVFADTFIASINNFLVFQNKEGTLVAVDKNTLKENSENNSTTGAVPMK